MVESAGFSSSDIGLNGTRGWVNRKWKTVLSNAGFVIEGYIDPTEPLRDEGPFGDHTG